MMLLALATAIAGVFFGAALYVSLVEHPARVSSGPEIAVREFRPSYRRGAIMQASLSGVGCVLGLVATWQLRDMHIAIGAVLLGLPIPWTLLFIAPTNSQLLSSGADRSAAQTLELLRRWGHRHWIRTLLGGLAFALLMFRLSVA
jgi:hypothetical protein